MAKTEACDAGVASHVCTACASPNRVDLEQSAETKQFCVMAATTSVLGPLLVGLVATNGGQQRGPGEAVASAGGDHTGAAILAAVIFAICISAIFFAKHADRRAGQRCASCGQRALVSTDSPEGRELLARSG